MILLYSTQSENWNDLNFWDLLCNNAKLLQLLNTALWYVIKKILVTAVYNNIYNNSITCSLQTNVCIQGSGRTPCMCGTCTSVSHTHLNASSGIFIILLKGNDPNTSNHCTIMLTYFKSHVCVKTPSLKALTDIYITSRALFGDPSTSKTSWYWSPWELGQM